MRSDKPGCFEEFARTMLAGMFARRRPAIALLISGDPEAIRLMPPDPTPYLVTVMTGPRGGPGSVRCRASDLPFQDGAFDLVVACHFIDGDGAQELAALRRVLCAGGQLVILGLGRWGRAYRRARKLSPQPALRPVRLCRSLRRHSFVVNECRGQGVAGLGLLTGIGWSKPLVGVSDQVLVSARHHDRRPAGTPLRFERPKATPVRPAVLDGYRREAAP